MIYGYIKTTRSLKLQKEEAEYFAKEKKMKIDEWIIENVGNNKKLETRKITVLLQKMVKGDYIIIGKLAHLGGELAIIMKIICICMQKEVQIFSINENTEIGGKNGFKALEFAFNLAEGIQRSIISERTKEALARKKAEGVVLGRPKGRKPKQLKLDGKETVIQKYLDKAVSISRIAKILKVHRITLTEFITKKSLKVITVQDFEIKRKTKK